ncbi:MAG: lipoyl(octanoyl) transferase LipB [Candidatus Latescibacterota bacterium]|nr:MAG: lipoyl(octanoyl) transferase LipB [Candidatus Latescibacterota bacterium]
MIPLITKDLGLIPFRDAYRHQRRAVDMRQNDAGKDTLYLLEHHHVVTKGRNATESALISGPDLLTAKGVDLIETDRGGDVTYHGPGQLVGYPIIRLEAARRDIRRYVHDVEEVLLRTLDEFSIAARRDSAHRGVWVNERKIASVGIRISKWVTSHGFALNVDTDLSYFTLIVPCGIDNCKMTTMSKELGRTVCMDDVKRDVTRHFCNVFNRVAAVPIDAGVVCRE